MYFSRRFSSTPAQKTLHTRHTIGPSQELPHPERCYVTFQSHASATKHSQKTTPTQQKGGPNIVRDLGAMGCYDLHDGRITKKARAGNQVQALSEGIKLGESLAGTNYASA